MSGARAGWTAVEAGALAALAALALAVLGGLLLKVWLRRRRRDRRRRLPRRRPAAVPRLGAPGRRARADRQPARPRARRARVPASRAAALGPARGGSGAGPGGRLPAVEAGRGRRAVRRHAGARAPLPGAAATTAGSRSCSRCSRARRWPRSSAGAGSGTRATSCRSTSSPASCGRARTCGATCSRRSRSGCCRSALLAYERGRGSCARGRRRGLLCAWLQPWQGATFAFALAARGAGAGAAPRADASARRSRALALPARGDRRAARLLRAARRASTRRGRSRPRSTTCRAGRGGCCSPGSRRSRVPGRVRVPAAGAGLRRRRAAGLAARRAARLLPAVRDVPVPRAAGAHAAARGARRARAARAGSASGRCGSCPRVAAVVAARRRRDRVPRGEPRRRRPPRPPAVHARPRASAPRCATSTRGRSRAACSRRSTPGSRCRPTRGGRRGSAPARGRRTSRSAREAAEALFAGRLDAAGGRGARAPLGRALRAERLPRPRGHRRAARRASPIRRAASAARPSGGCGMRAPRFPLVDALRALAALRSSRTTSRSCSAGSGRRRGPWLAGLNVGVPLFFAISGFLLYRPVGRGAARRRGAAVERGSTRVRRVLRIVPAYWVALSLIALAARAATTCSRGPARSIYFGLAQAYDPERFTGGIGQAWTLTVEVAFYAALPLHRARRAAAAGAGRCAARRCVLGGLVAVSVRRGGPSCWRPWIRPIRAYFPLLVALPAQLDVFAGGMALAVLSAAGPGGARRSRRAGRVARRGVRAARALAPGRRRRCGSSPSTSSRRSWRSGCWRRRCSAPGGAGPAGCSAWRPLAWVGLVSYGVYLWHLDVLRELAERDLPVRRARGLRPGALARARRGELVRHRAPRAAARPARRGRAAGRAAAATRSRPRRRRRDERAATRAARRRAARGAVAAARRAGGGRLRERRLLRRRAAVGGARGAGARRRRRGRRAAAAAALAAGPARGRRRSPGCSPGRSLSRAWAPLAGPAIADAQRLALYLADARRRGGAAARALGARRRARARGRRGRSCSATGSPSGCCRA